MNGEYLRGEVYWICLDDSMGGEEKTGRPAVIVSTNGLNSKNETVTVAYVSKQGFAAATRPSIADPNGGRQRVLCDQLRTVDKSRLSRYMTTLDESELTRVTGALACTLGIPIAVTKNEVVPAKKPDAIEDDRTALRCEADMWHRMYEKVMDQLVEIRVAADMAKKTVKPKSALPEPDLGFEEEEPKLPEEPKPTKKSEPEPPLLTGDKVNVNTATAKELMEKLGLKQYMAYSITGYRNKNGLFVELEELMEVKGFTQKMFDNYKDQMTISDEESAPDTEKKNSQE